MFVNDLCNYRALCQQLVGEVKIENIRGCLGGKGGVVSIRLPYNGYDDAYRLSGCLCNSILALELRMFVPAIDARECVEANRDDPRWLELSRFVKKLSRCVSTIPPMSNKEFLSTAVGPQKTAWRRAIEADLRYKKKWMVYDAFVKVEKYSFHDKKLRIPRLICPPSDHAKVVMGRHIKPIERAMKEIVGPGNRFPFMAKGMSSGELATRFKDMAATFRNPVFISIDMSKCDSTIGKELKRIENSFFINRCAEPDFRKCMISGSKETMQIRLGKGKTGRTFRVPQMRASGTAHTGAGNTLLVYATTRVLLGQIKNEVFSNGDDTIIIVEEKDSQSVIRMIESGGYSTFGFSVRIEQVTNVITDVFWCQCYYTERPEGPVWIRDHRKVMQTILTNENYASPAWLSYLSTIAMGEGSTNPGQPIVAPLVKDILSMNVKRKRLPNQNQTTRRWEAEGCPSAEKLDLVVTDVDRDVFYKRYGISPAEQIQIENRNTLALRGLRDVPVVEKHWYKRIHPLG